MNDSPNTLLLQNARIVFRNFTGKEGKYNREGDRNFCVLLDEPLAQDLERNGWNVKALRAREEGDPDQPYLQVSVQFKGKPPKIMMVTSKGKTPLGEDECEILDWIDIQTVDLILNPYSWSVNGKSGIKAYLKTLYVVVHEDELDMKYREIDELPARSGRIIEAAPPWIEGEIVEQRAIGA